MDAEKFLLSQEIAIPVYFTPHSEKLEEIYTNIKESTSKDSASSAAQGISRIKFVSHLFSKMLVSLVPNYNIFIQLSLEPYLLMVINLLCTEIKPSSLQMYKLQIFK